MDPKSLAAAVLLKKRPKVEASDELYTADHESETLEPKAELDALALETDEPISEREKLKSMIQGIFERLS